MSNNNKETIIQRGLDGNEIEVNTGASEEAEEGKVLQLNRVPAQLRLKEHQYDGPNLSETMKSLVKEFLERAERDPLKTWAVSRDFDVAHAKAIVEEVKILGVRFPQEVEEFLDKPVKSKSGREYQTKLKATFFLWLIGLRINRVREKDLEQRSKMGVKPTHLYEWADRLELGRLDLEELIRE